MFDTTDSSTCQQIGTVKRKKMMFCESLTKKYNCTKTISLEIEELPRTDMLHNASVGLLQEAL